MFEKETPFLLQEATFIEDDGSEAEENPTETEMGIFHTRCSHPRRRDD